MLDLVKLSKQLPGMGQQMKLEAIASKEKLELVKILLNKSQKDQKKLVELQNQWKDRLIFTAATPIEKLNTAIDIEICPSRHTVFATDGSQITTSHHEIAYCYLLNIGRIILHYGQNLPPLLDSLPDIFYKPEDLYASRKWNIPTDEWMGYKRGVAEIEVLADMAWDWLQSGQNKQSAPNLALSDGTLIYWFLDTLPTEACNQILEPILASFEKLYQAKIPLIGYLSASRNIDAINFLRFSACTFDNPNCVVNCGDLEGKKAPCQKFDPLRDTTMNGLNLQPGQRSNLWRSNSRILDSYPEHQQIYFCYVNVGSEIARIEFPAWVAEDKKLLNSALSITLAQVHKGFGYPVILAEAHNLAVVKGGDRHRFFALLEDEMIKVGLKNVGISYKETRKRNSIA